MHQIGQLSHGFRIRVTTQEVVNAQKRRIKAARYPHPVDSRQVDSVPLEPLATVLRHQGDAPGFRHEAGLIAHDVQSPAAGGDRLQLGYQLGQPPLGLRLSPLPQKAGDLIDNGQIEFVVQLVYARSVAGSGKQEVCQRERQVVDGQGPQLETDLQEVGQLFKPVQVILGGYAGRQVIMQRLALSRKQQRLWPVDASKYRQKAALVALILVGRFLDWPGRSQVRQTGVGRLKRLRVQWVGQHGEHCVHDGRKLSLASAAPKEIVVACVEPIQMFGNAEPDLVGRHQNRNRVVRVPPGIFPSQFRDSGQLVVFSMSIDPDPHFSFAVRRVGLGVPRRRRLDMLPAKGILAHFGNGMIVDGPVQHGIRRTKYERGGSAAVRQRSRRYIRSIYETREVARVSGSECTRDGLIRIADPNPISALPGQAIKQDFLKWNAILGFVFQDEGPPATKAIQKVWPMFQQIDRAPNQIVVVQPTLSRQRRLIAAVNSRQHVHKR